MSYIGKKALLFVEENLDRGGNPKGIIEEVRNEINDIDSDLDKSVFLQEVLIANEKKYQHHLPRCLDPENCQINFFHETISYYLNQELSRLGLRSTNDQFTESDYQLAVAQIEALLTEVSKKFDLQSAQYAQIKKELEELKELMLLGKKNWRQLFVGKAVEMVVSGVVSGTVSEEIIKLPSRFFGS